MKIERLNWDTEFFGYQIGKVEMLDFRIEHYEEWMKCVNKSEMKLIYIYPMDQISKYTLMTYKIPLVTTHIIFEKNSISYFKNFNNIESYYDTVEDYEEIEKLAILSGQYSRFRVDSKFTNHEFFRLYKEWIKNSISKEIASDVIVYKKDENIKGFVSYKINSSSDLVVGLIAVDPSEQGKGIGRILMHSVENIAFQKSVKNIFVSTQLENKQAMALYFSCGYIIKKYQEIYHLWVQ